MRRLSDPWRDLVAHGEFHHQEVASLRSSKFPRMEQMIWMTGVINTELVPFEQSVWTSFKRGVIPWRAPGKRRKTYGGSEVTQFGHVTCDNISDRSVVCNLPYLKKKKKKTYWSFSTIIIPEHPRYSQIMSNLESSWIIRVIGWKKQG